MKAPSRWKGVGISMYGGLERDALSLDFLFGSSPVQPQRPPLKRLTPPSSPSSPSPSSGPGVFSNPRLVPVMLSALNEPPGMNSAKSVSLRPNELFAEWSVDDLGW